MSPTSNGRAVSPRSKRPGLLRLLIALVRPDRWAEETQILTPRRCIKVAATLREARALRTAWRHPVF